MSRDGEFAMASYESFALRFRPSITEIIYYDVVHYDRW